MLRWFVLGMTPGLATSALKRYTSINVQATVLTNISNKDVKYWTEKYFSLNDMVFEKSESFIKNFTSQTKKQDDVSTKKKD